MSVVLIPTIFEDIHAHAVAVLLERMGHRALTWHCSDLPERAAASIAFEPGRPADVQLRGGGLPPGLDTIDILWTRRIGGPVVQTPLLPCDRDIALHETERFVRSLLTTLSDRCWAVNDYLAGRQAEDKLRQLVAAQRLGMTLPATLVSGDPDAIRRFVAKHEARGVVVKNFSPMAWQAEGSLATNLTARITTDRLPRDGLLRLTPAIYQAYVPKAFEVRVTCIGAEQVAVALQTQQLAGSRTDWRAVAPTRLGVERIDLPLAVAQQCQVALEALGLRFGCFDFIVTPDGEWVFLEVNQMGQFLWVEQANPGIPLLQMFCDFLVARDPAFRYAPHGRATGFADVYEEAAARVAAAPATHLEPELPPHVHVEPAAPRRSAGAMA